jgi:hypothetical protein
LKGKRDDALLQKPFSFTPGFSPVQRAALAENRFNGFSRAFVMETVKTVSLKP